MYLLTILGAFALGGLFALIVRTQLFAPDGTIFTVAKDYDHYNQIFTLHGAIMIFLVIFLLVLLLFRLRTKAGDNEL